MADEKKVKFSCNSRNKREFFKKIPRQNRFRSKLSKLATHTNASEITFLTFQNVNEKLNYSRLKKWSSMQLFHCCCKDALP